MYYCSSHRGKIKLYDDDDLALDPSLLVEPNAIIRDSPEGSRHFSKLSIDE